MAVRKKPAVAPPTAAPTAAHGTPAAGPVPTPQPLRPGLCFCHASVAWRDITPPPTIYARNWGAAKHDAAQGIHRPLTLTAVAFAEKAGAPPLILLAADLGWWRETDIEQSIRGPILLALNLPPERVIFNLSHTHSAPNLSHAFATLPGGEHIADYLDTLRAAALAAATDAAAHLVPATLEWTEGRCDLARHRDLPDPARPADQPRLVCGFNPAEPADDTVLVGRLTAGARTLATFVNYACHPVTLAWENKLISPDYVGALRETVEQATHAPCVFLQGASGELGPAEQYVGDPRVADRHGRRLGYAVLSALTAMLPPRHELYYTGVVESGAPLATWAVRDRADQPVPAYHATLGAALTPTQYPLKPDYPPLAEIERELARHEAAGDRVLAERLRRKRAIRLNLGPGSSVACPQWAWRLGDVLIVGTPHEAYSQWQLDLRRRFAPLRVVVMNLCNGSIGYLPPARLFSADLYQVWQTPFAAGGLERLTADSLRALEQLCAIAQVPLPPRPADLAAPAEALSSVSSATP